MRSFSKHSNKLFFGAMVLSATLLGSELAIAADPATLTIYTGVPREQTEAVLADFTKTYKEPLKFNVVKSPVEELMTQVNLEARSGAIKADILWFDKPQLFSLSNQHKDLLAEIKSEHFADMLPSVKVDDYKKAAPLGLILYVLSYNTDKYTAQTSPKSYADLLNSKYDNQIVLGDPRSSAAIHNFFWLVTDKLKDKKPYGWAYFDQLNKENPKYVSGHGAVRDLVISGERPVGIQLTFYLTGPIARGEKVAWNWPTEGVIAGQMGLGVIAKSKHLEASQALADWLLGPEGQASVAKAASLVPVNTKVSMKFPDGKTVADLNLIPVDSKAISENRAEVVRKFTQSLRK